MRKSISCVNKKTRPENVLAIVRERWGESFGIGGMRRKVGESWEELHVGKNKEKPRKEFGKVEHCWRMSEKIR